MASNVFKRRTGRRVSVAAATFAACLTMTPFLYAQASYNGVTDNGGAFTHTDGSGDWVVNAGGSLSATGGNATTGGDIGGGALDITNGDLVNRGTTTATGGKVLDTTASTATAGDGIHVSGDIHNYDTLTARGGDVDTGSGPVDASASGATGIKTVTGTLFNHSGVITATGGEGFDHMGYGGNAIEAYALENSAVINVTGGYSTMVNTGGSGNPIGGDGIKISDTMINKAAGVITAIGGEGEMHTTCGHAGMGGNALVIGGTGENYGILNATGGTASYTSTTMSLSSTSTGGIGMVFGGLVTNYESGQVLAVGGTPNSIGNGSRTGGTGINFAGGVINYSHNFRAEGASPTNNGNRNVIGGMGITVGPQQFWTNLSNETFNFKVENHGTIEAIGGKGDSTGSGLSIRGGSGMGVGSYFWYDDYLTMTNVELIAEVINKGTIIATAGDAESTNALDAFGGDGFTLGGGALRAGMNMTINSTQNHGVIIAKGGNAKATGLGNATGGWGMRLRGGTLNYGEMTAVGGLQLNGGGGIETGGVGMILEDGLTNYAGSYLTLIGKRSSTYANGAFAVQLGGTPIGGASDLQYGAWFKKGSFLSLGNADYAAGLSSGAAINANGLQVVFENDDPTWPEAMVISPATSTLGIGGKVTHTNFIVNTASDWGNVGGQIGIASYTGPVMDVTITQTPNFGNYDYTFEAERVDWSSNYLQGSTAGSLIGQLEKQFAGQTIDETNFHWANVLASVDFQPGIQDLRNQANYVYNSVLSTHTVQAMQSMARAGHMLDGMFSRNLQSLGKYGVGSDWAVPVCSNTDYYYGYAEGPESCEQYCKPAWLWLQPFYYTGTQKGLSSTFGDLDEDYAGVNLGFAQDLGPFVLALSGHYYNGSMESDKSKVYDGDVDGYGLELGLGRAFQVSENFNPWVELRAGYTKLDFEQTRWDLNGDRIKASPDGSMLYAGLKINNDYHIGERWTLTPSLGIDYQHLSLDSYKEKGASGLLLNVKPEDYDSLRGQLGLDATFAATDNLFLKLRAAYNYEFGDRNAEMLVNAQSLPGVKMRVSDDAYSRHSGTAGAGFGYVFCSDVSVGLDYDATFSDKYVGHQVTGRLVFSF